MRLRIPRYDGLRIVVEIPRLIKGLVKADLGIDGLAINQDCSGSLSAVFATFPLLAVGDDHGLRQGCLIYRLVYSRGNL